MPTLLDNLEIDELSFCEKGANSAARVIPTAGCSDSLTIHF
jgi:hypothetical protein